MFLRATTRKKDGKTHRYWSVVENRRLSDGRVLQRHVLYLGEISDPQALAWRRSIEVLDERAAEGNMDVVLVACRKDKLEAYISCVAQAGARPSVVDVDVFALQNAYEINTAAGGNDEENRLAHWLRWSW